MRITPRHPPVRGPVRRGTTAVEFAFVAPVFFAMVLGMIEVGRGIMVTHQLTSAARDACRVGVLSTKTYSDVTGTVDTAMKAQGITGYSTTVMVNDTTVTSKTFSASSNDQIQVVVSVPVGNITWVPVDHFLQGSLTGQFTLRRE
jgi:Flp pilus assembly protein TadG